jgi:hypothetical protein
MPGEKTSCGGDPVAVVTSPVGVASPLWPAAPLGQIVQRVTMRFQK